MLIYYSGPVSDIRCTKVQIWLPDFDPVWWNRYFEHHGDEVSVWPKEVVLGLRKVVDNSTVGKTRRSQLTIDVVKNSCSRIRHQESRRVTNMLI